MLPWKKNLKENIRVPSEDGRYEEYVKVCTVPVRSGVSMLPAMPKL